MDTLKLNSKQIQVAIDQLTTQPEGLNKLMEMALKQSNEGRQGQIP